MAHISSYTIRFDASELDCNFWAFGWRIGAYMSIHRWFRRRRTLRNIKHLRPVIVIAKWGQRTDCPHVGVRMQSETGMIGLYDYNDDKQGNATAEMHAKHLSHITGIPLHDHR